MVSDEKFTIILIVFPQGSNELFLPGCFQDFFTFSSQKFNYDMSSHGFLWVYFVWDLLSFLNIYVCFFQKMWRVFSHYFFKHFLSLILLLLSSWDSDGKLLHLVLLFYIPEFLLIPLNTHCAYHLFSLCFSEWMNSIDMFWSALIMFFVVPLYGSAYPEDFFPSVIIFFSVL